MAAVDYCQRCDKWLKIYKLRGRTSEAFTCGHQVSWSVGLITEKSTTPFAKWALAHRMLEDDPETSAKAIERALKVTYKTAWRIKKLLLENPDQAVTLFGGYGE